ncbi:hypothetical protein [Novosphingobium sp.]|jgi:hypothetical protein|uniref:hypothetical protein n=1 Tax=Novosphingobium sp. TaxID=1874826 RepID=UPI0022C28993|nr:hypothetical protein [Novosphingobium sp.]MCZ8019039.1 hypothetical protein [Novosphingobium sp.]MCZ8034645.1 hypothetical protein [Novosphingobium sp.]MCZ8052193.1 hypothetical protein [Novosphingobium sp.]MCZ8060119.1 hypothetical protein [Novosphingobium sp.]MCZ8231081.1 hypothetical protein [Novosphingobium sp.]
MSGAGYALYDQSQNRLEVIRPGESMKRYIPCTNIRPPHDKVHGVQIDGDDIWVFVGPSTNPRPNRKFLYRFSSLSGGSSRTI